LSQFPLRRIGLKPTGRKTATRSSYADARFVNRSRSSVTDAGASRHTTSITTGLASVVDAAPSAGRHSHSFHCSLCLIRITACRRAAMHCSGVLRSSAHGRRHSPSSSTLIVCPIRRRCGAAQVGWTVSSWLFPFSTWPLFVQPIGWLASIRLLTTLGHRRG